MLLLQQCENGDEKKRRNTVNRVEPFRVARYTMFRMPLICIAECVFSVSLFGVFVVQKTICISVQSFEYPYPSIMSDLVELDTISAISAT